MTSLPALKVIGMVHVRAFPVIGSLASSIGTLMTRNKVAENGSMAMDLT